MKKQISQSTVVLDWLRNVGSITSIEAFESFHITRLADVIYKLRKRGYEIDTKTCNGSNMFGAYTYAEYSLVEEPDGQ